MPSCRAAPRQGRGRRGSAARLPARVCRWRGRLRVRRQGPEDGARRARRVRSSSPGAHRGRHRGDPCDVAISAIGTNANPFAAKIGGKMELNKWGYIVADEETGQTTDPRIWAGGDIVTGAATVILAMGAGKEGRRFHHQEPAGRVITGSASHQTAKSPSSTRPAGTFSNRPPDHHDGDRHLCGGLGPGRSFCLNL